MEKFGTGVIAGEVMALIFKPMTYAFLAGVILGVLACSYFSDDKPKLNYEEPSFLLEEENTEWMQ